MWVEIMYASSDHDFKGKQLALHCRCGFAIDHGDEDNLVDGGAASEGRCSLVFGLTAISGLYTFGYIGK